MTAREMEDAVYLAIILRISRIVGADFA
jgi:hypothetical protein